MHAAYWKYTIVRRLTGRKRGSFPLAGSNFFARPIEQSERAWRADLALLDDMHHELRETIAALTESQLTAVESGRKATNLWLITGIAAHDLYHAGQIQLIKRLRS